jgi:hypothetical protein
MYAKVRPLIEILRRDFVYCELKAKITLGRFFSGAGEGEREIIFRSLLDRENRSEETVGILGIENKTESRA